MVKETVGPDDIAEVVASWTGIPAGRLLEGEAHVGLGDGDASLDVADRVPEPARTSRGNAERVGQVVRQYQTWQNTESTRTDTSRCVSGHHTTRKPVGRSTFTKTYRFVCSHRPHTNVTTPYREGKRIPMTRSRSLGRAWHARL